MAIDLNRYRRLSTSRSGYDEQIERLTRQGRSTVSIQHAVEGAIKNVESQKIRSFIIYGEPQSGKTEMMICLTAKLLDNGHNVIVHLLNDSVQLLQQNLERFQRSGLAPSAKNFSDMLGPSITLKSGQHVIFCKKNRSDLNKLLAKTGGIKSLVVIDDEADYATPNAKVNKGEFTKINELIRDLLGKTGIYIGVTATPARLDLNNTFDNDNENWVNFEPHEKYTGQDTFFPLTFPVGFRLQLLPHGGDDPKYLRDALLRFMATVAYVNTTRAAGEAETNFSMLVHTRS